MKKIIISDKNINIYASENLKKYISVMGKKYFSISVIYINILDEDKIF